MAPQERTEFAAKLRARVSQLAETKMELSLIDWNDIASDILDAADMVQSADSE